jgi:hypothetical protein
VPVTQRFATFASLQVLASEVFAGVLRAAASDSAAFDSVWHEWVQELLLKTLRDAKTELLGEWTTAVRYALSGRHPQVHTRLMRQQGRHRRCRYNDPDEPNLS